MGAMAAVAIPAFFGMSMIEGKKGRDEQRQQMEKSEARQVQIEEEATKRQKDADSKMAAIAQRDASRTFRKSSALSGPTSRATSVLTSPLGYASGSSAGRAAGGGNKTLLGM